MVVPLFKDVENKEVKKITYESKDAAWGSEELQRIIYIVPEANVHLLRLNFPCLDVIKEYKTGVCLSSLLSEFSAEDFDLKEVLNYYSPKLI